LSCSCWPIKATRAERFLARACRCGRGRNPGHVGARATLVRPHGVQKHEIGRGSRSESAANWPLLASRVDPLLTCDSAQTTRNRDLQGFFKPSDGLEPSTPSLPWNVSGNRSQPTATFLACFRRFRAQSICRCLPRVATTGLHKGSIPRSLIWQQSSSGRRC
jgi:hypothetical protein